MKKIFIFLAAIAGFTACSEDEIPTYSGAPLANIVFRIPNSETGILFETTDLQFANFVGNPNWADTTYSFRVAVTDINRDYDRTVYLKYEGDFNAADQTGFPKSVIIPANKVITDLALVVKRPAKADEGRDNIITISVVSDDDFTAGVNQQLKLDISLTPSKWVCVRPGDEGFWAEYALGKPSKVKNKIVFELFGTYVLNPTSGMAPNFSVYIKALTEYVDDYNANPDKYKSKYGPAPMKDENGLIVKIGG